MRRSTWLRNAAFMRQRRIVSCAPDGPNSRFCPLAQATPITADESTSGKLCQSTLRPQWPGVGRPTQPLPPARAPRTQFSTPPNRSYSLILRTVASFWPHADLPRDDCRTAAVSRRSPWHALEIGSALVSISPLSSTTPTFWRLRRSAIPRYPPNAERHASFLP